MRTAVEHGLRRIEGEAAHEHRDLRDRHLLVLAQEFPGAGDRLLERSVPPRPTALQELEALTDAAQELARRQDVGPRGGELDGEGDAVELFHQRLDGDAVHREASPRASGPIEVERHRVFGRERAERHPRLARKSERLERGGEDLQLRAFGQPGLDDRRGLPHDVLGVVEDQQELALPLQAATCRSPKAPRG